MSGDDSLSILNPDRNNGLGASALDGIDRFNRYAASTKVRARYVRNLNHDFFIKPEIAAGISESKRTLLNQQLFPNYVQASLIAKESQKRFYRAGKIIYVLSAAAVVAAAYGVLAKNHPGFGFGIEMLFLISIWIAYRQAVRKTAY